jgi:hypothetical protein
MPRLLDRGLTRILRSRWGIALAIGVIVVAIVGLGRVFGNPDDKPPPVGAPSPQPAISAESGDDDGVVSSQRPPSPVTSPGRAQPEAVAYAFASAWVDHKNVSAKAWHDGLLPNATKRLSDELDGVDPEVVPADRVLARPSLVPVSNTVVNAMVSVDSGKLTLRLIAPDGHWLVDGIDWAGS